MVAVRTEGLRELTPDGELEALRMLADRRDDLAQRPVQTVSRLQRLLSELVPGQRKRDLSALQANAISASVRPRDVAGKTRRRMAAEELGDLVAGDAKLKMIKAELRAAVLARGSSLMDLTGVGPAGVWRSTPPAAEASGSTSTTNGAITGTRVVGLRSRRRSA